MTRKKQQKFAELATLHNYIEGGIEYRGCWSEKYFQNTHPIILELGCGKGEYTNSLSQKFPGNNFIGIDLKGVRLWRGAKDALYNKLENISFIRANITEIEDIFDKDEIGEIWIPFPDPYPKPSKWKKRLLSTVFLDRYKSVLKKDGIIHFKTDNTPLYEFALRSLAEKKCRILENTDDLDNSDIQNEYNSIPTYFEKIFREQGEKIKYIRFMLWD